MFGILSSSNIEAYLVYFIFLTRISKFPFNNAILSYIDLFCAYNFISYVICDIFIADLTD